MAGGPAWLKSEGFDIQATASTTGTVLTRAPALQMLQTLLETCVGITKPARWLFMRFESRPGGPKLALEKKDGSRRVEMGDISVPSHDDGNTVSDSGT
jgi:hypothetical protein